MPTVREILEASGVDTYEINSISPQVTGAFERVLQEAQSQKQSVDQFWNETYNPGVAAWESERAELARKAAQAEAKAAYFERERESLKQSGLVTDDAPFSSRNAQGQFVTPGSPTFANDPNELVNRVAQGVGGLLDVAQRYQRVMGRPLEMPMTELIRRADSAGMNLTDFAEREFKLSQMERQQYEDRIRTEERTKVAREYGEKFGQNPDVAMPRGTSGAGMAQVRKDMLEGKVKDPTRMSPEERRQQTLAAIHRHVEERQQRDA